MESGHEVAPPTVCTFSQGPRTSRAASGVVHQGDQPGHDAQFQSQANKKTPKSSTADTHLCSSSARSVRETMSSSRSRSFIDMWRCWTGTLAMCVFSLFWANVDGCGGEGGQSVNYRRHIHRAQWHVVMLSEEGEREVGRRSRSAEHLYADRWCCRDTHPGGSATWLPETSTDV